VNSFDKITGKVLLELLRRFAWVIVRWLIAKSTERNK